MRHVTRHRSEHTNVFSGVSKRDGGVINGEGREQSSILSVVGLCFAVEEELGLLSRELHLVLLAVD